MRNKNQQVFSNIDYIIYIFFVVKLVYRCYRNQNKMILQPSIEQQDRYNYDVQLIIT